MRKLRWSYRVTAEDDAGTGYEEVIRFPRPMWFVVAFFVHVPPGEYRLRDGQRATVTEPGPQ